MGLRALAPIANVIDPFIDRVHARDEMEIRRGSITPTHLFAVMCVGRRGEDVRLDGLDPRACIRRPG